MTPLQSQSFPPKVKSTGDVAITGYSVLARKSPVVLLQCRLYTGKTHQIRVHLKDALGIEILTAVSQCGDAHRQEGSVPALLEDEAAREWRGEDSRLFAMGVT